MKIPPTHITRNFLSRIRRKSLARTIHAFWTIRTNFNRCIKHIPQQPQDRIVLLMFTCCLITFTRALLGLGFEEKGECTLNIIRGFPPLPGILTKKATASAANKTHMALEWREDANNAFDVAPPSIPQDAFPDPTPVPYLLQMTLSSPTTTVDASRLSQDRIRYDAKGLPFDPFRLEFNSDVEEEQAYLLRSTAQQKAKRGRRFGRCLLLEDCR